MDKKTIRYFKAFERVCKRKEKDLPTIYATEKLAEVICKLSRIAKRLNRIAEYQCNGTDTPKMQKEWERLEAKAIRFANTWNLEVATQGDPRGACLKLSIIKDGSTDFMGSDTDLLY